MWTDVKRENRYNSIGVKCYSTKLASLPSTNNKLCFPAVIFLVIVYNICVPDPFLFEFMLPFCLCFCLFLVDFQ